MLTVAELKEGLEGLDGELEVVAYEGEGGCWIHILDIETRNILHEFNTDPL